MRFELMPWRRPLLADDGPVVGLGGVAAVVAVGFVALHDLFDLAWPPALALAALGLASVVGAAYQVGHPRYPAGHVTLLAGQLEIDVGRGRPLCVPVADVARAFVQTPQGRPRDAELLLEITGRGWWRIRVERLGDPLPDLLLALHAEIATHADLAAFQRRSDERAEALNRVSLIGAAVVLLVGVAAALWSLTS